MFSYTKTVPDRAPEADRIVVIPDVHRDLDKARRSLMIAGVIDARDNWTGGRTVVVQVGDQVDGADRTGRRPLGPHVCHRALREDVAVLRYFNSLHDRAEEAGGAVYNLVGNHELMNVHGMFQYADTDGCPECVRLRTKAFQPGGPAARILATTRAVYLRVGRVAFVHAGLLPWHLDAMAGRPERLNAIMTDALLGNPRPAAELALFDRVCMQPRETRRILPALGVDHMVIGHNASAQGIVALHDGMVVVCDPGLSASVFDARPQALEITRHRTRAGQRPSAGNPTRSFRVIAEQSGRT
eukprot:jgi/Tetstr1/461901/TSEL_006979.t1